MTIQITGDAKEIDDIILTIQEQRRKPVWRYEKAPEETPEETHTLTVDEMARPDCSYLSKERLHEVLREETV